MSPRAHSISSSSDLPLFLARTPLLVLSVLSDMAGGNLLQQLKLQTPLPDSSCLFSPAYRWISWVLIGDFCHLHSDFLHNLTDVANFHDLKSLCKFAHRPYVKARQTTPDQSGPLSTLSPSLSFLTLVYVSLPSSDTGLGRLPSPVEHV